MSGEFLTLICVFAAVVLREGQCSLCYGVKEHLVPKRSAHGAWYLQYATPMKDGASFKTMNPSCGIYNTFDSACGCIGIFYTKGKKEEYTGTSFGYLKDENLMFIRNFTTATVDIDGRKIRKTSGTAFRRITVPRNYKQCTVEFPELKAAGEDVQIRYYDLVASDDNKSYRVLISCDDGCFDSKDIRSVFDRNNPKIWIFHRSLKPTNKQLAAAFHFIRKYGFRKNRLRKVSHTKCVYPRIAS
nr:PREDICTED: uncharacterized protein LOC109041732 [Bemisia tabaci]